MSSKTNAPHDVRSLDILGKLFGADETSSNINVSETKTAERVTGMLSNLIANEKKREREIRKQEREQEKVETAERFLKMGLTVEQVSEGSLLAIEDVERLKNDLKQ